MEHGDLSVRNLLARIDASCREVTALQQQACRTRPTLPSWGLGRERLWLTSRGLGRSWQHVLWLMTAAGVLLLIYAALYV